MSTSERRGATTTQPHGLAPAAPEPTSARTGANDALPRDDADAELRGAAEGFEDGPVTKIQRFRTTAGFDAAEVQRSLHPRRQSEVTVGLHDQREERPTIEDLDLMGIAIEASPPNPGGATGLGILDDDDLQTWLRNTSADALRNLTSAPFLHADGEVDPTVSTEVQGRYVEVEVLGRGGMGEVLRVTDTMLGRDVALKRLLPNHADSPEHVMALRREARIIGGLEHPTIIPVHELGTRLDGAPYYTMKLVPHQSLSQVIDLLRLGDREASERFDLRRLVVTFVAVAQGLEYAHSKGVIHRDLKPENVLLGEFGEVQIADWGIAKRMGHTSAAAEGFIVGTAAYMSPEQASGRDSQVDLRSDIYSLGVMLYEVLALRRPFAGETSDQQLEATRSLTPLPPSVVARDRDVPAELEALVMRMLAKRREDRPQSAKEVWTALERFLAGEAERERRRTRAVESYRRALDELARYREMASQRDYLRQEEEHLGRMVRPWDDRAQRWQLQQLRHRLAVLDVLHAHAFGTVTGLLREAIEAVDHSEAREQLIGLYWARHDEAESRQDAATKLFFAQLAHELEARAGQPERMGLLQVRSQPSGATVYAVPFSEYRDGAALSAAWEIGLTPILDARLPVGPYVIVGRIAGHQDAQETFYVREQTHHLLLLCDPWSSDFPLVGREVELGRLWSLLDDIEVRSRPLTCLVSGAAGMGKNMLLDAFRSEVKAHPVKLYNLLEVTCAPLRRDVPWAVVVEMIRARAGVVPTDGAEGVRDKVRRMVLVAFSRFGRRQIGDVERSEAHACADTLCALPAFDLEDPARRALHEELTEPGRLALVHALATFFQRLAVSAPVLMLIRNAQYVDGASREFLRDLTVLVQGAPILIVASSSEVEGDEHARSAESRRGHGDGVIDHDEHLHLEPLRPLAVDQLVRRLLSAPLNHKLLNWLRDHAGGNPFLAAEIIAVLVERRGMVFESGEWRLERSNLPEFERGDISAVVRLLLMSLPPAVRDMLSLAVVVGRVFWLGAVQALGVTDLDRSLEILVERGFVSRNPTCRYKDETEYRLSSSLRWRVAYDLQPLSERRRAHRIVAAWMMERGRTDLEECLAMAWHLEMGGQPAEAALLLLRAARAAWTVGALDEAARMYTRAHVLSDEPETQDQAELALRSLQMRIGERRRRRLATLL